MGHCRITKVFIRRKMNNNPTISIITPVYNVSKYLDRCIESIINQTFDNFELILIDDGSTDDSGKKCDDWAIKDSRIKVIHQRNAGAGAARNTGLENATGKYIGFVDSDDWVNINMYQRLYDLLLEYPYVDMAICETNWTSEYYPNKQDVQTGTIKVKKQSELLEDFFRIHGERSNYGIYNKLIRSNVLENFKFLEGTVSEDVMATYYFYVHSSKAIYVNEKLYNYFQNQSGVTKAKVTQKDFEYIKAFERIYKDIKYINKDFSEYAKINYIRANFSILSKMKLYGFDHDDVMLKQTYASLKQIVRKNFWILFKWKMPISRKILLLLVCL